MSHSFPNFPNLHDANSPFNWYARIKLRQTDPSKMKSTILSDYKKIDKVMDNIAQKSQQYQKHDPKIIELARKTDGEYAQEMLGRHIILYNPKQIQSIKKASAIDDDDNSSVASSASYTSAGSLEYHSDSDTASTYSRVSTKRKEDDQQTKQNKADINRLDRITKKLHTDLKQITGQILSARKPTQEMIQKEAHLKEEMRKNLTAIKLLKHTHARTKQKSEIESPSDYETGFNMFSEKKPAATSSERNAPGTDKKAVRSLLGTFLGYGATPAGPKAASKAKAEAEAEAASKAKAEAEAASKAKAEAEAEAASKAKAEAEAASKTAEKPAVAGTPKS